MLQNYHMCQVCSLIFEFHAFAHHSLFRILDLILFSIGSRRRQSQNICESINYGQSEKNQNFFSCHTSVKSVSIRAKFCDKRQSSANTPFVKFVSYRHRLQHSSRAHACGAKLLRSWVRFPPGAELFSSSILSNVSFHRSLKEVYLNCFSYLKNNNVQLFSLGRNRLKRHSLGSLKKFMSYF